MNTKRYILSAIAVFVAVFLFDFLVHGMLLKDLYTQTASLWRPEAEHKMIFMFMSQLAFAVILTFIFTRNYEDKGLGEGLRFGLYMGLLLATIDLGTYCYMPIPLALTLSWVAASIGRGIIAGIVLSLVYKR